MSQEIHDPEKLSEKNSSAECLKNKDDFFPEHEKEIFQIIESYLSLNKIIEIDKIIPYITSILAKRGSLLNQNGIENIVKRFIEKKIIFEGSRLIQSKVLENEKRKKIYEYIKENPGIYHYQILKNVNVPSHIVIWHLDVLLKFDYIRKIQIENHLIYFTSQLSEHDALLEYFLKNQKSKIILDYLDENKEGSTQTQLVNIIKMHPQTVKKYLKLLHQHHMISKKKVKGKIIFFR